MAQENDVAPRDRVNIAIAEVANRLARIEIATWIDDGRMIQHQCLKVMRLVPQLRAYATAHGIELGENLAEAECHCAETFAAVAGW